jgi:hypothetical protein
MRKIEPFEVKLNTAIKLTRGELVQPADRLFVAYPTGNEYDLLIFEVEGRRHIRRITGRLQIASSSPAIPASAWTFNDTEPLDAEDEVNFLTIYDSLEAKTFKR